jgi:GTP cyclohydrolase I
MKPSSSAPATLSPDELAALPASERIRYRLVTARRRHHANDNIADFVQPGELEELKAEVAAKMPRCSRPW